MDGAQSRVQQAISQMVDSLDKGHLRSLQLDMYKCSTKCCEDKKGSLEQVQSCVERCSNDVNRAQAYLQNEIESFQSRLQRCAMSCQDKIKDKLPATPSDDDVKRGRSMLEGCVIECADSHVEMIPGMTKKMIETLKSKRLG